MPGDDAQGDGLALALRLIRDGSHARIDPADQRAISAALSAVLASADTSLELALGLCGRWRERGRKQLRAAERALDKLAVHELRRQLLRYAADHFATDLATGCPPAGERAALFTLVVAHGGTVPTVRTLQRDRATRGPLNLSRRMVHESTDEDSGVIR